MIVTLLEGRLISNQEGSFLPLYCRLPSQPSSLGPLLLLQPEIAVSNPSPRGHQNYDRARIFHYFGRQEQATSEAREFRQKNPGHYDTPHLDELLAVTPKLNESIEISTINTTPGYCQHIISGKKLTLEKLSVFDPYLFRATSPTAQFRLSYQSQAEIDDELLQLILYQQTAGEIIGQIRRLYLYPFLTKKSELIDASVSSEKKDRRLTNLKKLKTSYIQGINKIKGSQTTEKKFKKQLGQRSSELGIPILDLPIQPLIEAIQELEHLQNLHLESAKKYQVKIESDWTNTLALWKYSQNGIRLMQPCFTGKGN